MNKILLLLALVAITGCSRKTTVAVTTTEKPLTNAEILKTAKVDKYEVTSPHGHSFAIEVTRFDVGEQTYNNTCKITYIVTNTGTKDFKYRETFNIDGRNGVVESDPAIVFEFVTKDGKRIEKSQFFYDDLMPGRSSEVRDMSIDVGLRACDAEVKPVRFVYKASK